MILHARCILYVCQARLHSLFASTDCSAAAAAAVVAQPEAVVVADDAVAGGGWRAAGETSSRLVSQLSCVVCVRARDCWH